MPLDLSIVVLAYEMREQAMRTLTALAPAYQQSTDAIRYEVIAVDNGSIMEPLDRDSVVGLGPCFRLMTVTGASSSPVRAVNAAVASTEAEYVGVILDGACLVTPGVIAGGMLAQRLGERVMATAFAWHLGPDVQQRSAVTGYGPAEETELLARAGWPTDGYGLFDVATIDPSNPQGWFGSISESRFFVMPRSLWDELGGYDERFESPGGGLAALDFFRRVSSLDDVRIVGLVGEGTFHQVHGGITTNTLADRWADFHAEYERVAGESWAMPAAPITYLGDLTGAARSWVGAARVGDHLQREMRARGAAVPVQGAQLVDASGGFHPDGWVAGTASLAIRVPRPCDAVELVGWLPGDMASAATLRVDGETIASGPVGPGTFVLRAEACFVPGRESAIEIEIDAEVPDSAREAGDDRDLAWQVGVVRLMAAFTSGI